MIKGEEIFTFTTIFLCQPTLFALPTDESVAQEPPEIIVLLERFHQE